MLDRWLNQRPEITAHDIVTRAMHRTGDDQFGADDWSEPLEVLCRSLELEARLHHRGRRAVRTELTDLLVERASEPEAAQHSTVAVATLDEAAASNLVTELCRVPEVRTRRLAPTLTSMDFERRWHIPGYAEWLAEADLIEPLARLRAYEAAGGGSDHSSGSVIEVVTSPMFIERIETLRDAMPTAVIVQIHTDVPTALGEMTARSVEERKRYSDDVDPDRVERYWTWRVELMMDRNAAGRAASTIEVIDLDRRDITDSPQACAERVLSALGR